MKAAWTFWKTERKIFDNCSSIKFRIDYWIGINDDNCYGIKNITYVDDLVEKICLKINGEDLYYITKNSTASNAYNKQFNLEIINNIFPFGTNCDALLELNNNYCYQIEIFFTKEIKEFELTYDIYIYK